MNKMFLTPSVEQLPGRQIDSWASKTIARYQKCKEAILNFQNQSKIFFIISVILQSMPQTYKISGNLIIITIK